VSAHPLEYTATSPSPHPNARTRDGGLLLRVLVVLARCGACDGGARAAAAMGRGPLAGVCDLGAAQPPWQQLRARGRLFDARGGGQQRRRGGHSARPLRCVRQGLWPRRSRGARRRWGPLVPARRRHPVSSDTGPPRRERLGVASRDPNGGRGRRGEPLPCSSSRPPPPAAAALAARSSPRLDAASGPWLASSSARQRGRSARPSACGLYGRRRRPQASGRGGASAVCACCASSDSP